MKEFGIQKHFDAGQQRWYVLEVLPNKSTYAIKNLNRQGFHTFYPHFRTSKKYGKVLRSVLVPLFPRYVFVNTVLGGKEVRTLNSTYGVKGLLSCEAQNPSSVCPDVMRDLLSRCDSDEISGNTFSCGDEVRFISGPLYGRLASIESLDSQGRVMVLFQLLGAENRLVVEQSAIVPANM